MQKPRKFSPRAEGMIHGLALKLISEPIGHVMYLTLDGRSMQTRCSGLWSPETRAPESIGWRPNWLHLAPKVASETARHRLSLGPKDVQFELTSPVSAADFDPVRDRPCSRLFDFFLKLRRFQHSRHRPDRCASRIRYVSGWHGWLFPGTALRLSPAKGKMELPGTAPGVLQYSTTSPCLLCPSGYSLTAFSVLRTTLWFFLPDHHRSGNVPRPFS